MYTCVEAVQGSSRRRFFRYLIIALFAFAANSYALPAQPVDLPPLMLWAWERPENLTFINPAQTGVAFLAESLFLSGSNVLIKRRHQPLFVPPGTRLLAVAHVGVLSGMHATGDAHQRQVLRDALLALAAHPGYAGLQIDYEAPLSMRHFYHLLLASIRNRLPPGKFLSVTALSSSCLGDNWVSHLPVNEVVPMLFSMGEGTRQVYGHFIRGGDFSSANCRTSLGVSAQEVAILALLPRQRRLYVFNNRPWTPGVYAAFVHRLQSQPRKGALYGIRSE